MHGNSSRSLTNVAVNKEVHAESKILAIKLGRKIGDYATEALTEKNEREEAAIKALKRGNRRGGKAA